MKKTLISLLLGLPLAAHAQCQQRDALQFFAGHAPRAACPPSDTRLCLALPRLVDDDFHDLVVAASAEFLPKFNPGKGATPSLLPVVRDALRMDLTRRSAYVTCDGLHVYFQDSGGIGDKTEWRGPVAVSTLYAERPR